MRRLEIDEAKCFLCGSGIEGRIMLDWARRRAVAISLVTILALVAIGYPFVMGMLGSPSTSQAVPAQTQMKTVTGTLAAPFSGDNCIRCEPDQWGRLILNDRSEFDFICDPWHRTGLCAYSKPASADQNIGKRLALHYFDVHPKHGPPYVVMEVRGVGPYSNIVLLNYSASAERIEAARSNARNSLILSRLELFAVIAAFVLMLLYSLWVGPAVKDRPATDGKHLSPPLDLPR